MPRARHLWSKAASSIALVAVMITGTALSASAETKTVRIGLQYGVTYLPFAIVEHDKLIEKYAKEAGLGDIEVSVARSAGGTTMNDAILSGNMDIAATGFPSFLTLWSRGRGKLAVKALASYGATPLFLLTRNPKVKSLKDFSESDRIAVPAVKSSIQAILLQIASKKAFGSYDKLDPITVSRSHPDATAAVLSDVGELNSHFSAPPYQFQEAAKSGVTVVTTSNDIFGGPLSNGIVYMTEHFHDENPKTVGAILKALTEALALVNKDPKRAAEIYLEVSRDKMSADEVLKTIQAPGSIWDAVPRGTERYAEFMKETGAIKTAPASWKDVFFPEAHGMPGN
jgi:NitT/TauT family transport system substrate-binding protein